MSRTGHRSSGPVLALVVVLLLSSLSLLLLTLPLDTVSAQEIPSNMGDWTVTGDETYEDGSSLVTGDIIIETGGRLTLTNVTIRMDSAWSGANEVRVKQGGSLFLHNSTLVALDPAKTFDMVFEGGATSLVTGSTIRDVGNVADGSGIELLQGSSVIIRDTVIKDVYNGVVVHGTSPQIENCTLKDGGGTGILVLPGSNPIITESVVSSFENGYGVMIQSSKARLEDNTILTNERGLLINSSEVQITRNYIRNNYMGGVTVVGSTVSARSSEFLDNGGVGFQVEGSEVEMIDVDIGGNMDTGLDVVGTALEMDDSSLMSNTGTDLLLHGNMSTGPTGARLVNSSLGSVSMEDTNPNSELRVSWYLLLEAHFMSDRSPVTGAEVWLTDSTGTTTSYTTGEDGVFGPRTVLSYILTGEGKQSRTPHNLTVRSGGETLSEMVDLSSEGVEIEMLFDDIPPYINLDAYDDITNEPTARVSGLVAPDTARVAVDGEQALVDNMRFEATVDLEAGENNIEIKATDRVGNSNTTSIRVMRDILPPHLDITSPRVDDGDVIHTNIGFLTIEGVTEPQARLWIGGNRVYQQPSGRFTVDLDLVEGENLLELRSKDQAGNVAARTITVVYDADPPSVTLKEPSTERTRYETVRVSGTVDDTDAVLTLDVNGDPRPVPVVEGNFHVNVKIIEGTNIITVTATDRAGNKGMERAVLVLDTVPPQLVIDSPMEGHVTSAGTILVSGMSDEDALLTVNGEGVYRNGLEFYKPVDLEEGINTVDVVSRDDAGNVNEVTLRVTRDSVAPIIDITIPEDGARTAGEKISVEGFLNEEATLMMNGRSVNVVEGMFRVTVDLEEGENVLDFEARDHMGNLATESITIVKDSIVSLEIFKVERVGKDGLLITGRTDPDAELWIDGERYDTEISGLFRVVANIQADTDFEVEARDGMGNTRSRTLTSPGSTGSPAAFDWNPVLLWVSLFTMVFVVGLFGGTERGRLFALFFLFVPLYSKLKKNTVLDHYTRGQIHGYIVANPGDHYNSIKQALKLNNGTLAYHIRVLEKEGIIKSKTDGIYKRFYPSGMKVPEDSSTRLTEIQKIIIKRIKETPGISQKEVSKLVGVSPSTINYHINILKNAGLVRSERRGMRVGYFLIKPEEKSKRVSGKAGKDRGAGKRVRGER